MSRATEAMVTPLQDAAAILARHLAGLLARIGGGAQA